MSPMCWNMSSKKDYFITICYQQYINNVMACFPLWHLISEQTEHHQTLRPHLRKISFPNLLQRCLTWQMVRYFVPRVSTFFATKSSLWEKRVSTYFCRRFLKTFCNNLSRDSGDEEILHNPKLYKTIFCFALMKVTPKKFEPVAGHLFAMSKFKKYERTWHWSHVSESGLWAHLPRATTPYWNCTVLKWISTLFTLAAATSALCQNCTARWEEFALGIIRYFTADCT